MSSLVFSAVLCSVPFSSLFFFFNAPAPTEIYTLFPTRRSSDLLVSWRCAATGAGAGAGAGRRAGSGLRDATLDRKSTRLNSSHVAISYAVFCLKKKKKKEDTSCSSKQEYC